MAKSVSNRLELVRGRTHLVWEITRDGLTVTTKVTARSRKDVVSTRRFRQLANAKRAFDKAIADQRARGFRDVGAPAPQPDERTDGKYAVARVKSAMKEVLVPRLRGAGFKGSFPMFRRIDADRHCVIWFMWGRAGGFVTVGLGVLAPRKDTSVADDRNRALNLRNRERTTLGEQIKAADGKLLYFACAAKKWGDAWPTKLASLVSARLQDEGARWLESPARRKRRKR